MFPSRFSPYGGFLLMRTVLFGLVLIFFDAGMSMAQTRDTGADTTRVEETDTGDDARVDRKNRVNLTIGDRDDDAITININGDVARNADYVRFGESVTVEKGEEVFGDVVAIGGKVTILGRVNGDCVAIGSDLEVGPKAEINGEAVCIGGTLILGDSCTVRSNAVSVWGSLDASSSAIVLGELTSVEGFGFNVPQGFVFGGDRSFGHSLFKLFSRLVWVLILAGLGVLAFSIFPSRMERLADTVEHRGLVSFLAGLAGWILWLPAFILLLVTVVGIPVAILLLFLTPIMTLLGYLGVAMSAGKKAGPRLLGVSAGNARMIFFGVLILEGTVLAGRFFGLFPSVFDFLGGILTVIGYCVIFIAATMGFGAFLMTRFRPMEAPQVQAGAMPPPPPPPPAAAPGGQVG